MTDQILPFRQLPWQYTFNVINGSLFPKLDDYGDNYWAWSDDMKMVLKDYGLWDVVSMGILESEPESVNALQVITPPPSLTEPLTEEAPPVGAVNRSELADRRASRLIMLFCSPYMKESVMHAGSAKERWDELRERCITRGRKQIFNKIRSFIHYQPPADRTSHSTVRKVASDLSSLQDEIEFYSPENRPSDAMKLVIFYRALRQADDRFEPFVSESELEALHDPDWTYGKIEQSLKDVEQELDQKEGRDQKLLQSYQMLGDAIATLEKTLQLESDSMDQEARQLTTNKHPFTGTCFYCGKAGHKKRNCGKLRSDRRLM
ncbi:hypothetical protein F5884DRAFT_751989 [Xylogone sp. PMI_703]|nr:hypothetical protein F5884DRAFT_751989 [Xylogone sp. PMI_703]